MDENILKILACPKCRNSLALTEARDGLCCESCAKVYPIKDGVPHLLIEEGVPVSRWEREAGKPSEKPGGAHER